MHLRRYEILRRLIDFYGAEPAKVRLHYWALFFLIIEETWRLRSGQEYIVTHKLFEKP